MKKSELLSPGQIGFKIQIIRNLIARENPQSSEVETNVWGFPPTTGFYLTSLFFVSTTQSDTPCFRTGIIQITMYSPKFKRNDLRNVAGTRNSRFSFSKKVATCT